MEEETPYVFPSFDDLPGVPGTPQGCLWGFYDRDNQKDEVGGAFKPPCKVQFFSSWLLMMQCVCSHQPSHNLGGEGGQQGNPIRAPRSTRLAAEQPAVPGLQPQAVRAQDH